MALGLNNFDGDKSRALESMVPEKLARCHFRAQKSLDFQGPSLPFALGMDFPPKKIITSRAIQTTGTLTANS